MKKSDFVEIMLNFDISAFLLLSVLACTTGVIRFFHQSHNAVLFGGLFTLKQWIISSLKHDTVPRVNKLYCFYVKNTQNVLHYGIVKTVNWEFATQRAIHACLAPFVANSQLHLFCVLIPFFTIVSFSI